MCIRRALAVCVLLGLGLGCSSSNSGGSGGLVGTWMYVSADMTRGFGLTFRADNTYTFDILLLTSPTTANAEIESGTYSTSGTTINITPQQWTCPGPDAIYTITYSQSGDTFEFMYNGTVIAMSRDTASGMLNNFAFTEGCTHDASGNPVFTPMPLAPVSNH